MFKLVIFSNSIEFIKKFCNCIINEISELQLSGMATELDEFDKLVEKVKPEIILMDYSNFINSKYSKFSEAQKLKILFCNDSQIGKNTSTKLYISDKTSTNETIKFIREFISKQSIALSRKKIIKVLESFCFDFKLIGTTYLLESILYCYENKTDYVFENLEKNVYPKIANICNTSVDNVKFAIIRSINTMHSNLSPNMQKQLSENLKVDISEKTTAKQLISTIVTKLY